MPKLRRNLISLGLLDSNGYTYKLEKGVLKLMKGSLVVMKGKLTHGLYILEGSFASNLMNFTSDIINKASMWH